MSSAYSNESVFRFVFDLVVLGVVQKADSSGLSTSEFGDDLDQGDLLGGDSVFLGDFLLDFINFKRSLIGVEYLNDLRMSSVLAKGMGKRITYELLSVQQSVVKELSSSEDDIFSHNPL